MAQSSIKQSLGIGSAAIKAGPESLIFMHIPKTAGMSLRVGLRGLVDEEEVFETDDAEIQENDLKELSDQEKQRIRLVIGHFAYGIHNYLPQSVAYFTMLRHPVDRVISHYYYLLGNPERELHAAARTMTLQEFARSGLLYEIENGMCRYVSGLWHCRETLKLFTRAKQNLLHHFVVFGLTERYRESLRLLSLVFGWPPLAETKTNISVRPNFGELDPATFESIAELNEADMMLYDWCSNLMDQWLKSFPEALRI